MVRTREKWLEYRAQTQQRAAELARDSRGSADEVAEVNAKLAEVDDRIETLGDLLDYYSNRIETHERSLPREGGLEDLREFKDLRPEDAQDLLQRYVAQLVQLKSQHRASETEKKRLAA